MSFNTFAIQPDPTVTPRAGAHAPAAPSTHNTLNPTPQHHARLKPRTTTPHNQPMRLLVLADTEPHPPRAITTHHVIQAAATLDATGMFQQAI